MGAAPATPISPLPTEDEATRVILVPKARREPVPIVGRARPPVRPALAVGIGLAVVGAIAVAGLIGFAVLPSASIVLAPWSAPIGPLEVEIVADPEAASVDPTTMTVPARLFTFDVATSQSFTATGAKVTEAKATGSVTFRNCDPTTGGGVAIPAGARVATSGGIGFVTQARLTIKRPPLFSCRTGSVSVEAERAGTDGNVAAGKIDQIPPGYDPLVLFVTNEIATAGGVHDETPQISQADVDQAVATLTAALPAELESQVAGAPMPSGMTLYPGTKRLGTPTPTVDPATLVGLEQATFDLGLTAKGTVLGVATAQVQALAEARLGTLSTTVLPLDRGSISVQIGTPSVVGDFVTFPVTMSAQSVRVVDRPALLAEIRGLDLPAARARLDDFGQVTISVWPDWVTTIPTDLDRVTLTVSDPQPTTAP